MAAHAPQLVEELNGITQRIKELASDNTDRNQLLTAAKNLARSLEHPDEELYRFIFQPGAHACYLVAVQHGLLESWPNPRMSVEELAEMTKMDRVFLARIMRALAHYGIFTELEEEVYEHSPLSIRLSTPPLSKSAFFLGKGNRTCASLPEYIEKYGATNPSADPSNPSLFTFTNEQGLEYFEWLRKRPDLQQFNEAMSSSIEHDRDAESGRTFLSTFPFESELADVKGDEFAVVDVGGGWGHLLKEFRKGFPCVGGRLGLLDIPETIEGAKTKGIVPEENVVVQAYDFFAAEQPLKGARFYILRHVLHDWPDHACRTILKNTMAGMTKGKSKILLVENILAPVQASAYASLFDIQMMKFGGMGRKESQWRELAESVGLRLVKAWPAVKNDRIMELVPVEWSD